MPGSPGVVTLMICKNDNLNTNGISLDEFLAKALYEKLKEYQKKPLISKKKALRSISFFRLKKEDIEWVLSILEDRGYIDISKKGIRLEEGVQNLLRKQTREGRRK